MYIRFLGRWTEISDVNDSLNELSIEGKYLLISRNFLNAYDLNIHGTL